MSRSRKWASAAAAVTLVVLVGIAWWSLSNEAVGEFVAREGEPAAVATRASINGDELLLEGLRLLRSPLEKDTTCELVYIGSPNDSAAASAAVFSTNVGSSMAAATPGQANDSTPETPKRSTLPVPAEQSVRLVSVRSGRVTKQRTLSVARVSWFPPTALEVR